ncbi:MAG: hypothetical protein R3318_04245 [Gammaproteobacteria bacterium]|nr:hypothetical protein [Gammaproteobacteria bacterium]
MGSLRSEKYNGGKNRDRHNQYNPFTVMPLQPTGKVQDDNDDCEQIDQVKPHIFTPLGWRTYKWQYKTGAIKYFAISISLYLDIT